MTAIIDPRTVARTCMCLAVRKAARAVARRYDEAFHPLGITSGQFSILMAISADRPIGMIKLAEELGMDRTTLTAAVKPLERNELIVSRPDPSDGRRRRFQLTPKGRAVLEAAIPAWQQAQSDLERHAAAADFERLRTLLANSDGLVMTRKRRLLR